MKDAAGYVGGRVAITLIAGLTAIAVARYLGPANLGLLSFAGAVFALVTPFSLLGMRLVLMRDFSTERDWRTAISSALAVQIPIAIGMSAVAFLVVAASRDWDATTVAIALAFLPLPALASREAIQVLHEASKNVRIVVIVTVGSTATASVVKLVAVVTERPVWIFAAATTLEALLATAGLLIATRYKFGPLQLRHRFDSRVVRRLIRESWPLLVASLAIAIYMRIDIVMLGLLSTDETTGLYTAAARLSELTYFIPMAVASATRPRLARLFTTADSHTYDSATTRYMQASWISSLAVTLGTFALASPLILIIYGSAFSDAAAILRIHVIATPFVYMGVATSQWFVDNRLTRALAIRTSTGAALNVLLNLALIPHFGGQGAAIATVVSYAASTVLLNAVGPVTKDLFMMQVRSMLGLRNT